jgi:hypothetical protein
MADLSEKTQPRTSDFSLPKVVQENMNASQARRVRRLIRWRIPGKGFLDMYINPQQLQIQERKIIKKNRTKGGYVIQYWGEELPTISLRGNTASSGIEGINILRSIYRAEQNAFTQIAKNMSDSLGEFTAGSIGGLIGNISNGKATAAQTAGSLASSAVGGLFGSSSATPLYPTLASLAVGIEMFYQGWVFKGYFENFNVTESVSIGPGIFEYDMTFIVVERRGVRTNFMDWHRSPTSEGENNFNKSDPSTVAPNFKEEK